MGIFKRILLRCLTATLVVTMAGCDLDEYNPSNPTAEAIWMTSPEGFLTLVNAAYEEQRYFYGKEDGHAMTEAGTDLWTNQPGSNYAIQLTRYESFTPISSGLNWNTWRSMWKGVNLTNAGINRIAEVPYPSVQERNVREAELRFLRAFYYWHIVEWWGGVMRPTTETKEPILTATRRPTKDFYELIIGDLTFAAEHLPLSWGTGTSGPYSRATRKAALGMLARAYLSGAYHLEGAERTNYFEHARNVANRVINERVQLGAELHATPAALWNPNNNKNNKEALHIISNSSVAAFNYDDAGNKDHQWYLPRYSNKPTVRENVIDGNDNWGRFMPTRALLDFFDEEKDARYAASFQEVWLVNFDNNGRGYLWGNNIINAFNQVKDPSVIGKPMPIQIGVDTAIVATKKRMENKSTKLYLVYDRDDIYNPDGTVKQVSNASTAFPALQKFRRHPNRATVGSQAGFEDIMVIRLAEMYMVAAEAEFQLNNTEEAARHINVIRARAAKPGADMQITSDQVTLDFILNERAREFAGEHMRWFDLKRTGKLVERVRLYNPDITAIQDYHVLRPIPQQDMDLLLNKEEFKQNPGYQ